MNKKKISELGEDIGKTLDFSFAEMRERDWPNVITCHSKLSNPLIWSKENGALSKVSFGIYNFRILVSLKAKEVRSLVVPLVTVETSHSWVLKMEVLLNSIFKVESSENILKRLTPMKVQLRA